MSRTGGVVVATSGGRGYGEVWSGRMDRRPGGVGRLEQMGVVPIVPLATSQRLVTLAVTRGCGA